MNEIIEDEIHAISENYAGIISYFKNHESMEVSETLTNKTEEFSKKYAEYLYSFNKEKVIEILIAYIMPNLFGSTLDEDYQFIFRPEWNIVGLKKSAHFLLKFKRSKNDNLDEVIYDH